MERGSEQERGRRHCILVSNFIIVVIIVDFYGGDWGGGGLEDLTA